MNGFIQNVAKTSFFNHRIHRIHRILRTIPGKPASYRDSVFPCLSVCSVVEKAFLNRNR